MFKKKIDLQWGTLTASENPFHPFLWKLMLLCGVMMYGSYGVLMHLCKKAGKIPFSSASLVVMIELAKLVISIVICMQRQKGLKDLTKHHVRNYTPYSIPALLYCINNNIAVHAQHQMDAATFQMLCNLKIIFTTVLYRIIIKRPITTLQWVSLHLLTVGGFCASYGSLQSNADLHSVPLNYRYITKLGLVFMFVYCLSSGFAGVYSEKILKQQQLPLPLQNIILYSFGTICNSLAYLLFSDKFANGVLSGFSPLTWIVVLTQAINGLIMSAIMKYSSNITRMFYIACGMFATIVISIALLDLQLNFSLFLACFFITFALVLYHR